MAGTPVDVGTGTTIGFGTSSFTSELLSLEWDGIEIPMIAVPHMGTADAGAGKIGNVPYISGDLTDGGEVTCEFHFDPDKDVPINGSDVFETVTVTWPKVPTDATAATWVFNGKVSSFSVSDPLDDKMTATMTIKVSGSITLTAAA